MPNPFLHVDCCSGYCTLCIYVVDYSCLSTGLYLFVLTTVNLFFFMTIFVLGKRLQIRILIPSPGVCNPSCSMPTMYSLIQTISASKKLCKHKTRGRLLGNPADTPLWCGSTPSNLLVKVTSGTAQSCTEIKVFQRQCLSPLCEICYSITDGDEISLPWFVLDCYLFHCHFLGAFILIIFFSFYPKKEECQHYIFLISWNISPSFMSSK